MVYSTFSGGGTAVHLLCELPTKSARGVQIHLGKMHKAADRAQNFKGRLADAAVQTDKLTEQQKHRTAVICEGEPLENVFKFKYRYLIGHAIYFGR